MESAEFIPKLIVFDLDGTLTESKQPLVPSMGKLLVRLMEKMVIAVTSGGSFAQFKTQFLPGLPPDLPADRLYIFPTDAAQCYFLRDGEWHQEYNHSLSLEEKAQIVDAIHRALAETGFGEAPKQVWGERVEDRDAEIAFSYYGQEAPLDIKSAWDPDSKKRIQIRAALLSLLTDFSVTIGGKNTIQITRKGVTKSFGLRALARITGIDIKDMLYVGDSFGDGGNDTVVEETGVHTQQVSGPAEVEKLIAALVS